MGRHRTSQGTGPPRKPAYYVVRYLSYSVKQNLSSVYFVLLTWLLQEAESVTAIVSLFSHSPRQVSRFLSGRDIVAVPVTRHLHRPSVARPPYYWDSI